MHRHLAEFEFRYHRCSKLGKPFEVMSLREIQLSSRGILEKVSEGRAQLSTVEWKDFLLRSVGLEPGTP